MWTANNPSGKHSGSEAAQSAAPRRLYYLDFLKLVLLALVVAHHASQPYGPADWWYVEGADSAESLSAISAVNGSFMMSLFFFVSAFLLPSSYDKKGARSYVAGRFRQFGPPILFGFFVIIPALMYAYYVNFRGYGPIGFGTYYLDVYLGMGERPEDWTGPIWPDRQFAHLWFIQHLLVYALLYAAWRAIGSRVSAWRGTAASPVGTRAATAPGAGAIVAFVLAVSAATFVLRIWYPVDLWVPMLEFIQAEPADLAQFAAFFIAGIMAYRYGWLAAFPTRSGFVWLGIGIALAVVHVVAAPWLNGLYAMGGWDAGSLLWSVVETLMGTALSIGLLTAFREWAHRPNRVVAAVAPVTFTVYVLHVPVVVALQYAVSGMPGGPLVAFGVVAVVGTLASFALAWGVRRTPFLRALV